MAGFSSGQSGDNYLAKIESLVGEIIRHGGFDLKSTVRRCDPAGEAPDEAGIVVDFQGRDSDLLLEKNAALLDALEYVVLKAIRADENVLGKIVFDCKDWRQVRAEELKLTASMAARQVIETGSPFSLNPMNPRERRIVHLALKDQTGVRTLSEGSGQLRKVVIFPAAPSSSS
ncbi:MAG TPA: R3H domain-containing nucleic acid-binding protein [Terriglobia bacterium]|nr:R3H domain-containing nucleic acid-binding protein [Terriglobia bacterium]